MSNDWVTRGDALAVMWHFFFGHTVIPPNTYYHFASTWSHFSHKTGSTSSQVLHVFSELLWLRNDGIFHNFRRAVHCCSSDVNVCRFDLQLINFLSFYMPPVCCTSFVDIFLKQGPQFCERTLKDRTNSVWAFPKCSGRLVSGSEGSTIKVWDHSTWKCEHKLQEHTAALDRGNAQEEETWHLWGRALHRGIWEGLLCAFWWFWKCRKAMYWRRLFWDDLKQ